MHYNVRFICIETKERTNCEVPSNLFTQKNPGGTLLPIFLLLQIGVYCTQQRISEAAELLNFEIIKHAEQYQF